ncbi:MAG TPA: hypothetical protein DHW81_00800, partial [Nitrospiraceae bacterium]|nr:hypothetical protein [Nitrospiraceae bacterium]
MKLAAALFLVVLISGCASMQTANQSNETVRNDYTNQSANVATGASRPDILESGYSGTVLAGSVSPVIEFNMNDYQAAAGSNKIIL